MRKPLRAAVLVLLCALLAPALARAQDSPFSQLPPAQQPTTTQPAPQPTGSTDSDGGGLTSFEQVLIGVAGALVLAGVAWLIVRDARRSAPTTEREMQAERARELEGGGRGTRPSTAQRKTANRKRNKAVKAARRHNR